MDDKWLIALAGLLLVAAAFGLKVWHAQGVCADQSGQWTEWDCVFEEKTAR